MARKRQIDPGIWTSEQFCGITEYGARLLFIGMFSNADDEGRLKASPVHLKTIVFPADQVPTEDVEKWRNELSTLGLIIVYKFNGVEYLFIPKFSTHQFISKPYPSRIPAPFLEHSLTTPEITNTNTNKETLVNNSNPSTLNDNDNIGHFGNGAGMWKTELVCMSGEIIDLPTLWERLSTDIRKRLSPANFNTWIKTLQVLGVNGNVVYLTVQSSFHLENIMRLEPLLTKSLYEITGRKYAPSFKIDVDPDGRVQYDEAADMVCLEFSITHEDLVGVGRNQEFVSARRELCKRMMATGRFTATELGRRLNRDHATILNLLKERELV